MHERDLDVPKAESYRGLTRRNRPNSSNSQPGRLTARIGLLGPPSVGVWRSADRVETETAPTTFPSSPRIGDPDIPPRIGSVASVTQRQNLPPSLQLNQCVPSSASSQPRSSTFTGRTETRTASSTNSS